MPSLESVSRSAALVLAALAFAPAARAAELLVVPFDLAGASAELAGVEAAVRSAATAVRAEVAAADATRSYIADAVSAGLSCSLRDISCALRLGSVAGASELILVAAGDDALALVLLDVARGEPAAMVSTPLPVGDAAAMQITTRLLVRPATLRVDAEPPGARVLVDGVAYGDAPLPAVVSVEAGEHGLLVIHGELRGERRVVVPGGASVSVRLQPEPPVATDATATTAARPPPQPEPEEQAASGPFPVAGVATTAAGALLVAACGTGVLLAEADASTPKPGGDTGELDVTLAVGRALLVCTGVGALAVGVGGVLWAVGE